MRRGGPGDRTRLAGRLRASRPSVRIVKALNANVAATLASGQVGDERTTIVLVGDDDEAKAPVRGIVEGGSLTVVDAGSLLRAVSSRPSASYGWCSPCVSR
ncbi:MAG: hypothetical protein ACK5IN_07080 [Microbacterium sp.]|uniref:hypothetical protein n=1 Tax=Microbacterium sp. TaxID=51671 RepID=UPI003A83EA14